MAERDVLGESMKRMLGSVGRARERMQTRVPYGPLRQNLSSKEARLAIQNLDPMTKQEMRRGMGDDQWETLMEKLYGGN